ncbi:MAG: polysaccharide biosynthesis/export family protein [Nitrospira sp.]|jgi:polysaccharide export outer membrane protein
MANSWSRQITVWVVMVAFCTQFMAGCANKIVEMAHEPQEPLEGQPVVEFTDFMLGPGDEVEVEVYRHEDLTRKIKVPGSGIIFYPLVGEIDVKTTGATELRRKIQGSLKERIVDPQVSLSVRTVKSQKVYVLGEVKAPAVFTLDTPTRAAEMISKAGGFTGDADSSSVILIRNKAGKPDLTRLNLEDFFEGNRLTPNVQLQPGDVLFVPRTFVADMDRFFTHALKVLFPILLLEQAIVLGPGVRDAVTGSSAGRTQTIIISPVVSP